MQQDLNGAHIVNIRDVTFHEPTDRDFRQIRRRFFCTSAAIAIIIALFGIVIIFKVLYLNTIPSLVAAAITLLSMLLILSNSTNVPPTEVCYGTYLDTRMEIGRKRNKHYYTFSLDDTGEVVKDLRMTVPFIMPSRGDHIMITRTRKKGKVHYEMYSI